MQIRAVFLSLIIAILIIYNTLYALAVQLSLFLFGVNRVKLGQ